MEKKIDPRLQALLNGLIESGVKPGWLGRTKQGKIYEYRSLPWAAGHDLFVMVQEPEKSETLECLELMRVEPLALEMQQKLAA